MISNSDYFIDKRNLNNQILLFNPSFNSRHGLVIIPSNNFTGVISSDGQEYPTQIVRSNILTVQNRNTGLGMGLPTGYNYLKKIDGMGEMNAYENEDNRFLLIYIPKSQKMKPL